MKSPLVTIGMPVFNGELFISKALQSLLDQTYSNFELVISENCSTDNTYAICKEFAQKDSRIRLIQQTTNIGSTKNFNGLVYLAKGKYFMWAAYDDLWHPDFIQEMVAVLENNPSAVLACSDIQFIDENGNELNTPELKQHNNFSSIGLSFPEIASRLLMGGWISVYGLMRLETMKQTNLFLLATRSDILMCLNMLMRGDIYKVNKKLFLYRQFSYEQKTERREQDTEPYRFKNPSMIVEFIETLHTTNLLDKNTIEETKRLIRKRCFTTHYLQELAKHEIIYILKYCKETNDKHTYRLFFPLLILKIKFIRKLILGIVYVSKCFS